MFVLPLLHSPLSFSSLVVHDSYRVFIIFYLSKQYHHWYSSSDYWYILVVFFFGLLACVGVVSICLAFVLLLTLFGTRYRDEVCVCLCALRRVYWQQHDFNEMWNTEHSRIHGRCGCCRHWINSMWTHTRKHWKRKTIGMRRNWEIKKIHWNEKEKEKKNNKTIVCVGYGWTPIQMRRNSQNTHMPHTHTHTQ